MDFSKHAVPTSDLSRGIKQVHKLLMYCNINHVLYLPHTGEIITSDLVFIKQFQEQIYNVYSFVLFIISLLQRRNVLCAPGESEIPCEIENEEYVSFSFSCSVILIQVLGSGRDCSTDGCRTRPGGEALKDQLGPDRDHSTGSHIYLLQRLPGGVSAHTHTHAHTSL